MGRRHGHVTHFLNFGPRICIERVKTDISNLCRLIVPSTSKQKINSLLCGVVVIR